MRLTELLHEGAIKVGLDAVEKDEAIHELVDHLIHEHELSLADRRRVLEALAARERLASTGMEGGVALPHAAVDEVDDLVAVLGISERGVPFDTLDGEPAHLIFLLLVPRGSFRREIAALAGIARLLRDEDLRRKLCRTKGPEEAMRAIAEAEAQEYFFDPHAL